MKMQVRAVLILIAALATMGLTGCGHYNCATAANFGSSSCSSSGGGLGGGGGTGNSTATAFAFHVDQGQPTTTGFIDGYTLDLTTNLFTTTPNFIPPVIPQNLGSIGMVVGQKQYVYAVFADLQAIYGWQIDFTTGFLTPLGGFPMTVSLNIPSVTYNQYLVITNPPGTLLFISDPLDAKILVYQIGSSGSLTAAPGSPFSMPSGFTPQNLGMDGLGNYLYASSESVTHTSTSVMAFAVTGSGSGAGVLQPVQSTPFPFPMWQTQGDPSGKFLFGVSGQAIPFTSADDDHIYLFSIGSNGAITQVSSTATAFPPFNMAVQPSANSNGTLVYTFSRPQPFSGNPVEGFQLNSSLSTLPEVSGSPFINIDSTDYALFDPNGNTLFFYLFSASSNLSGLTTFQASSTGTLTLGPAVTLSTNGYFAVVDVQ